MKQAQIDLVAFKPSEVQREAKSAFLVAVKNLPIKGTYSLADVKQLIPQFPNLEVWWANSGFREWFLHEEEFAVEAELAAWEALQTCRDVMKDSAEKGTARVNAAKLAFEIAGKMQRQQAAATKDSFINNLNQDQLVEFIRKHVKLLPSNSKE